MAMQARAERTREALIRAAADVMGDKGYKGATLVEICRSAQVSMGALTFHFASKSELAEAVVGRAADTAGERAADAAVAHGSPLRAVGGLLQALARLLDEDTVVRAGSLLARERPDIVPAWHSSWTPTLWQLLTEAAAAGELRHGVRPPVVAGLAMHLLAAVEMDPRTGADHEVFRGAAGAVSRLWPLVCHGIAAAPA
ncbi:TetR family transcriptional regulator [Streptomyces sp. LP11]|uniref:TetR family transcriptional regulator n=1 Tax=Streptomyces pyxinicus TaxID=2970331 RepID=A0ABT2BCT4_9ACTN|nr:TetR/AcrR family transcriptional regulator [Streptomyces sp. LP11]MCS0605718.1 TetR family transcriptional regulator [Streptomyces sp. LP11]